MNTRPILVLGATGYVGGRLVPRLLDAGYRVRAVGRSPSKLLCRPWGRHPGLEIVRGDVLDVNSLRKAAQECGAGFYLVHSMISAKTDFSDKDRTGARNMAEAAAKAGMERIIYLGGLGESTDPTLSEHLKSRHEVEEILREGSTPVTVLRAAMILGSGSASFEILRYLVDRLPLMLVPPWVRTRVQPISIGNVLEYLEGCLEHEETAGATYDIGGPEVLTYEELMVIYAEIAGLPRRKLIPISFMTPKLSSLWIHLVTPIPSAIARPLAEGLSSEVVCRNDRIRSVVPVELHDCRTTIRIALERIEQQRIETCWSDAGAVIPPEWTQCGDAEYAGGTILRCGYSVLQAASPEEIWERVTRIGGKTGWYFGDILWRLRGLLDQLAGGTGLNRGRRHPSELFVGDALDFWRVLEADPPHRLLLLSEMKTPGEAVLEFKIIPQGENRTELRLLSRFLPRGLAGLAYWYALLPFHELIFGGMLRKIVERIAKPVLHRPARFDTRTESACAIHPTVDGPPPGKA